MGSKPKPKPARKAKHRRKPPEKIVDYMVEIEGWDFSYWLALNTVRNALDPCRLDPAPVVGPNGVFTRGHRSSPVKNEPSGQREELGRLATIRRHADLRPCSTRRRSPPAGWRVAVVAGAPLLRLQQAHGRRARRCRRGAGALRLHQLRRRSASRPDGPQVGGRSAAAAGQVIGPAKFRAKRALHGR